VTNHPVRVRQAKASAQPPACGSVGAVSTTLGGSSLGCASIDLGGGARHGAVLASYLGHRRRLAVGCRNLEGLAEPSLLRWRSAATGDRDHTAPRSSERYSILVVESGRMSVAFNEHQTYPQFYTPYVVLFSALSPDSYAISYVHGKIRLSDAK